MYFVIEIGFIAKNTLKYLVVEFLDEEVYT